MVVCPDAAASQVEIAVDMALTARIRDLARDEDEARGLAELLDAPEPPALLLALMGLQINQLIFAIILATGISLVVAITAAKLFSRLPAFRASDPNRLDPAGPDTPTSPPEG